MKVDKLWSRQRQHWPGVACFSIAGIGMLYVILVVGVLPSESFLGNDAGVKFLQVQNLVRHKWRSLGLDYPGEDLDPEHRFWPFHTNHFHQEGSTATGVYSVLFTVPVSVFYALLGFRGLYVVPILATVGTMVTTYRLGARLSERIGVLASVLVGVATPMLVYSLDLWEHTLTVFLSTLSVLFLLDGLRGASARRVFAAGFVLGLSVCTRLELLAMAVAMLMALVWTMRARCFGYILAFGAGLLVLLVPLFISNLSPAYPIDKGAQEYAQALGDLDAFGFVGLRLKATELLVPLMSKRWMLLVALILSGRIALYLAPGSWKRVLLLVLATGMALGTAYDIVVDWSHQWRPDSLLQSFPLVLALAFLGVAPELSVESDTTRRRDVLLMLLMAGCFVCVVWATADIIGNTQWGPRYLMPVYPLLVVPIVYLVGRGLQWTFCRTWPGSAIGVVFVLLVLFSIIVQIRSVRYLWAEKQDHQRLIAASKQSEQDVFVTDLWWYPHLVAAMFYDCTMFVVESDPNGQLVELLPLLLDHGIRSFTFVGTLESAAVHASSLERSGWEARAESAVSTWVELRFVTYERVGLALEGGSER